MFAIFDMNSDSHDLVNADYFVGAAGAYAVGPFQALARVFHQSSHLGDEFLLHDRPERVNLSYEAVDLKLSYHFFDRVAARLRGRRLSLQPGSRQHRALDREAAAWRCESACPSSRASRRWRR